ncbi:MAG: hypothetical protein LBI63_02560 [Candidatus Ancillula sp.]|jgi:hypothetical protein|nr:hypothetical protein [Candidatus Ancillula sp.]
MKDYERQKRILEELKKLSPDVERMYVGGFYASVKWGGVNVRVKRKLGEEAYIVKVFSTQNKPDDNNIDELVAICELDRGIICGNPLKNKNVVGYFEFLKPYRIDGGDDYSMAIYDLGGVKCKLTVSPEGSIFHTKLSMKLADSCTNEKLKPLVDLSLVVKGINEEILIED